MAGAIDGIASVENRTLAGKIIVYPMLHDVPLIPLSELHKHYPTVAAKLTNGQWNKAAEQELLRVARDSLSPVLRGEGQGEGGVQGRATSRKRQSSAHCADFADTRPGDIVSVAMVAQTYTYSVILEPDDEAGGFAVHVPALPGCHTQGDTRDEAIAMAQDAITVYIESLLAHNEPIPVETDPAASVLVTVTVKADVQTEATTTAAAF